MEFSIGLLKPEGRCLVRDFKHGQNPTLRSMDISDMAKTPLKAMLYQDADLPSELEEYLKTEHKYYPIRPSSSLHVTEESFQKLDQKEALGIVDGLSKSWVLSNNLHLLENLFSHIDHLSKLYPNNRSDFFEELWFILKKNIGAGELTLIYNDLGEVKKEGERPQLIRITISGHKLPSPVPSSEVENKLFTHFESEFGPTFHLCEYIESKRQFVATMTIKNSPILLMAKAVETPSKIQMALLKSLMDGLNQSISFK